MDEDEDLDTLLSEGFNEEIGKLGEDPHDHSPLGYGRIGRGKVRYEKGKNGMRIAP